ncbi:hypothetical protein B0T26DRAFT_651121 [Lasiosphaeria miniovina]|uniref:Zn(2)-C6 fungal-type domain-containing protein n=1 Tax=Lasiosphaeria miniovina TaxID=1954250 RepID=A0AA40DT89_9PEZI|nr:uncharacterized protein B0T26DRAFT_651121 [Lasiosphaeria miniovina]KAK0712492.1 hypothetical protein B0T26DRAFT_651121 [Lasiosphaeria miniovina]
MSSAAETKACDRCAKAKRKCDRGQPACVRCATRELTCTYPAPRPSCWVLVNSASDAGRPETDVPSMPLFANVLESVSAQPRLQTGLSTGWFLTPETWVLQPIPKGGLGVVEFVYPTLHRLRRQIHSLMLDWVSKGSSPLIHARLYQVRFPRCMQDAYMTLSAYTTQVPQTEKMVRRIISDRSAQLMRQYARTSPSDLDAFEHLARVQALLIFTALGFFDEDDGLRHIATTQLQVLERWSLQMLEATRLAAGVGLLGVSPPNSQTSNGSNEHDVEMMWHAWIIAESVRRTWFMSCTLQAIHTVTHRYALQCHGDIMFTLLTGVFDAPTCWAWAKICSERDISFMSRMHVRRLLGEKTPDDVDFFGKMVLELMYGVSKVQNWGAD